MIACSGMQERYKRTQFLGNIYVDRKFEIKRQFREIARDRKY